MMLKSSHRHTIMSGRVVTYAQDFKTEPGVFGERYEPLGAFEVSASRDAVMVHRAEIASPLCMAELQAALTEAWAEHNRLARFDGRPRLDEADRGAPREMTYNAT